MDSPLVQTSEGVYYFDSTDLTPLQVLNQQDLLQVTSTAPLTSKKRSRVCMHSDINSDLQIMYISLLNSSSVPVHKHIHSNEYYHILSGRLKLSLFDSSCQLISDVLLEPSSNLSCCVPLGQFHSVESVSEASVYIEITKGPFLVSNTLTCDCP